MSYIPRFNIILALSFIFASCGASVKNDIPPQKIIQQYNIPVKPVVKKRCDPYSTLCLKTITRGLETEAFITNNKFETRTASLKIWSDNVILDILVDDIKSVIIPAKQTIKIAHLKVDDISRSHGFNFNFNSVRGKLEAVHDDNYIYDLPFETGKEYKLIQSYGGKFSHSNEQNYYSYDFQMPIGSIITAAREGTVIEVKQDSNTGGNSPNALDKSNYIYIEHSDGTISVYGHLMYKGSLVKVGNEVQKGQNIAYSGNTGYVDSPHLHFSVAKFLKNATIQSLPVKIQTSDGVKNKLQKYERYKKP